MSKIVIVDDEPQVISYESALFEDLKEVSIYKSRPKDTKDIIARLYKTHTVVITKATTIINNNIIENLPELRHIAVFGTALDHIDLDAAKRNNIIVTSIPNILTNAVAEHAISLMMSLNKKIPELDRRIRSNEWPSIETELLEGKTLGVIGSGVIGEKVARIGFNLGMKIIINPVMRLDKIRAISFEEFAKVSELEYLLEHSDVVTIHTRVTDNNKYLLDRSEISLMKNNALLINTARGKLVNENVLYNAIVSGKIGGAALDVFETEPIPEENKLRELHNVILTSHNAANATGIVQESIKKLIENIKNNL
jgi:phosphoglycerate dehydrogenase-like enzyme